MKKYKRLKLERQGVQNRRICAGDQVFIRSGNDAGKTGKVLSRTKTHVIVEGVNLRKKTVRKSEQAPNGQILEMERPIHLSNVAICDSEENPVRLKARQGKEGKKELFFVKDGQEQVHRTI